MNTKTSEQPGITRKKAWLWFIGIYTASVAAVALVEFGSRWILSFT